MKNFNINKLGILSGSILAVLLIISTFISVRAYKSTKELERQIISQKWDSTRGGRFKTGNIPNRDSLRTLARNNNDKFHSSTTDVKKLEEFLTDSEVEQLSDEVGVAQNVLKSMVKDYATKEMIRYNMNDGKKIASEQIQKDIEQYGEKFKQLRSQAARMGVTPEEKSKIFDEILDSYPDSYSSAKILYGEILKSSLNKDIDKVEEYYNRIWDIQDTKSDTILVNDGLEVVPNSALMLAQTYYRTGQIEDAKRVVMYLEDNYSDSLYFFKPPGRNAEIFMGSDALGIMCDLIDAESTQE